MKIFILEDDPTRIGFFLRVLSGAADVHLASDVESARSLFAPPYDWAFLDHDLGGRQMVESYEPNTGYQFLVRVVKVGDLRHAIVHSWNPTGAWAMYSRLQALRVPVARQAFDPRTFEMLIPAILSNTQPTRTQAA